MMRTVTCLGLLMAYAIPGTPAAADVAEPKPSARPIAVPAILSTDLSLDRDPDDWFDTLLFLTLPGIEPRGIVLEHYATDEVLAETRRLCALLGRSDVPVAKGAQGRLQREGEIVTAPAHDDGALLILRELRQSDRKLTLIAVGALTNEALAWHRQPELFRQRVAAIHFAGGNIDGDNRGDVNVQRDPLAVQLIFEASVPLFWVPCSQFHKQKLSGEQERAIAAMGRPSTDLLTEKLRVWRKRLPPAWLEKSQQLPHQGKNLWSLPALLHVAGIDVGSLVWINGHAHFSHERWTWFETDPAGPHRMLIQRDSQVICQWLVRHLQSLPN
jgi:inosine-uridine nucleoside N-ribohydrolase